MMRDERFRKLIYDANAAQIWILERPHSSVTLGDVFRLCGAVQLLLDHVKERKTEDEARQASQPDALANPV